MKEQTINLENAWQYQGGFVQDVSEVTPDSCFYIVRIDLKEGQTHKGHSHYIDHVGNMISGKVKIEWKREDGSDEGIIFMDVPAKILIRADTWHKITAIEPTVWECWFAQADAEKLTDEQGKWNWMKEKNNG